MFIDKAKEAVKIAGLNKNNLFVFGEAPDVTPFSSLLKHGENVSLLLDTILQPCWSKSKFIDFFVI